jgi:hypothetical protein
MGMRRNIALNYGERGEIAAAEGAPNNWDTIYLYTHWGAEGLEEILAKALEAGKGRWGDDPYLARIIFTHFTQDASLSDATGYGLSPYECDPQYPTLYVDLRGKAVNGVSFEDFIKNPQMFAI